jgi:hypothetical protein
MGYTIKIGNAVPVMPQGEDRWAVVGGESPDAPSFPGEEASSTRSPSYTQWANFCRDVNLVSLLGERGALMASHPGVALLRPSDLAAVRAALLAWRERPWPTAERIAGFNDYDVEPDPRYDGNLARLLWLEFWIDWALRNCEYPALGNT